MKDEGVKAKNFLQFPTANLLDSRLGSRVLAGRMNLSVEPRAHCADCWGQSCKVYSKNPRNAFLKISKYIAKSRFFAILIPGISEVTST